MKINGMPQTSDISKNGYVIYSDDGVDSQKAGVNDIIDAIEESYSGSVGGDIDANEPAELIRTLHNWAGSDEPDIMLTSRRDNGSFSYDFTSKLYQSEVNITSLGFARPEMITHTMKTCYPRYPDMFLDSFDYSSVFIISTMAKEFPDVRGIVESEVGLWPVFKYPYVTFSNLSGNSYDRMEGLGNDPTVPEQEDYPSIEDWRAAVEDWIEEKNENPLTGMYDYRADGSYKYSTYVYPPEDPSDPGPEIHYNPKPQNPDGTWKFVIDCIDASAGRSQHDPVAQIHIQEWILIPVFYYEYIYKYDTDHVLEASGRWIYTTANEHIEPIYYKDASKRKEAYGEFENWDLVRKGLRDMLDDFGYSELGDALRNDDEAIFKFCDNSKAVKSITEISNLDPSWGTHMPTPAAVIDPPAWRKWILVTDPKEFLGTNYPSVPSMVPDIFAFFMNQDNGSEPPSSLLPDVRLDSKGYYSYDYNYGKTVGTDWFMNYALGVFDIDKAMFQYDAFPPAGSRVAEKPQVVIPEGNYSNYIKNIIETASGLKKLKIEGEEPYEVVNNSVVIPCLNQYNIIPRRINDETYIGVRQAYLDTLQPKLRQGYYILLHNDGTIETDQLVQDILFNDQSIVDPVTHIADVDSYTVGETIHECIPINSDSMDISMEVEYDPNTLKCTKVYTPNVSSGIKPADIVQTEPEIYVIDSSNVGNLYHTLDYVDIHAGERALITFTACAFTGPDIVMIAYIDGGIALNPLPTGSLFTTGFTDYDIGVNRGICTRLKVVKVVEPDQDTRYNMRFIQNMTAAQMGTGEMNVFHTVNVKYLVNT